MSREENAVEKAQRSLLECVDRQEEAAMAVLDEAATIRAIMGGDTSRDKRKSKEWERMHYRTISGKIRIEAARQFYSIIDEALLTPSNIVAAVVYLSIGKPEFANRAAVDFVRRACCLGCPSAPHTQACSTAGACESEQPQAA